MPCDERVPRARQRQPAIVEPDLAAVWCDDAGKDLEEGRLAGAVLAHEGVRLAGAHGKADAGERAHRAEGLVDVEELEVQARAPTLRSSFPRHG